MQSSQGSYCYSQSDAVSTDRSDRDVSQLSALNLWKRTGFVAGTAVTLAFGSTLHLGSYGWSQLVSVDQPPDSVPDPVGSFTGWANLSTDLSQQDTLVVNRVQSLIRPVASTQIQFSRVINGAIKGWTGQTVSSQATQSSDVSTLSACQTAPQSATCANLEMIDAKLPDLHQRVQALQSQLQQFQDQHSPQTLETHQAILVHRNVELSRQKAEIGTQLSDVELQLLELQQLLSIQAYEGTFVENLLLQDARYQDRLAYLQEIDQAIADTFSEIDPDEVQLEALRAQYQQTAELLYEDAYDVLVNYLYATETQVSTSLWQEPMYRDLLQRMVESSHKYQVLLQRSDTYQYLSSRLKGRYEDAEFLLQDYLSLKQQLEAEQQILQRYLAQRETLVAELNPPKFSSNLTTEANLATASLGNPFLLFSQLSQKRQNELALALLIGAGILTALVSHQRRQPHERDYSLDRMSSVTFVPEDDQPLPVIEANPFTALFETYSEEGFELFAAMAVAIVVNAFRDRGTMPIVLSQQLLSEMSEFKLEPITISWDDAERVDEQPIKIALYGMELDDEPVSIELESMPWHDIRKIFGAEVASLAAA